MESKTARKGISLEDVKAAIQRLESVGASTALRSIRAELGDTGSIETIHRHVKELRAADPAQSANDETRLSGQLTGALARELARLVAEKTATLAQNLLHAESAADVLTEECARLRGLHDELQGSLRESNQKRLEQEGTVAELRVRLRALEGDLQAVREDAESARQHGALSLQRAEFQEQQRISIQAVLEHRERELNDLRQQLELGRTELADVRTAASALQAHFDSRKTLDAELRDATARLEAQRKELDTAHPRMATLEAERASLSERLNETRAALNRAEANLQSLLAKVLPGPAEAHAT